MGKYLALQYDNFNRLLTVSNEGNTTLMTCSYDTNGLLSQVADAYGRQITYTFTTPNGVTMPCLTTVSQIGSLAGLAAHALYFFIYRL